MALWLLLFTLAMASSNSSFSTMTPASGKPHIIQCRSPEMETFSCYWSTDDFPHKLESEKIQLLYSKRLDEEEEWKDCPDYTTSGKNSCYFNISFTAVWVPYSVRLYIADQLYDEKHFRVEDIVIPDPPVGLNWTVLNTSPSGVYTDVQVTWKPPPSADVDNGWLIPFYQLQYKDVNATEWHELDPKRATEVPVYSLKTCQDYEIRVRAKGIPGVYGEFSEVLYVSFDLKGLVPCAEEFQIPWPLVMAFGIVGLIVMLSLVFFSKKQKLKILIFPPVPVPKIKGIDPDLLKKGKLDEVNSILASHGSYMPQLYGDDSWVEFIELDIDEAEDRTEGSDTDRLLGDVHMKSHGCLAVRDDDSGRASCCEPDIPETDFSASDTCDGTSDIDQSKKKMSELHGKNHVLNLELDKTNKLLTISQSREEMAKQDSATFQNVIKGLQQTIEDQYNLRDENEKLKNIVQILEKKLKTREKEHENMVDKLIMEIKNKEKEHNHEQSKLHSDMNKQLESKMEEHKKLMEKKDLNILELTKQLKAQEKEKQNEIFKLQIEFNTKLERLQTKTLKVQANPTALPQNIYRKKLQHLQEEKNKEIEILRNVIKDLEQKLDKCKDCYYKLRQF
ncbi:growth hormone receptor isoform X3 [Crotalus tigris]|uniref:growth hormone receptor isoform X3 n=1 Tax=Crotalus tigris TaxID=88082 RepID=UPI00192F2C32|nr:growth hormone receptor isoform X3 [Crotalus tigris]